MDLRTLNIIFYDDRLFSTETIRYIEDNTAKEVCVTYLPRNKQSWEIITGSNERELIVLNQTRIVHDMPFRAGQSKSGMWYISLIDYSGV